MRITENIHGLKITFPSVGGVGHTVERFVYVYLDRPAGDGKIILGG